MSLANKLAREGMMGDSDAEFMGDPGIFGTIKSIGGKFISSAIDIVPGPIGFAARKARSFVKGRTRGAPAARVRPGVGRRGRRIDSFQVRGRGTTGRAPSADIDFRINGGGVTEGFPPFLDGDVTVGSPGQPVPACPQGQRPNKSSYFRRSPAGGVVFIRKGTVCVSSRRRNALNPRALDRAIGRVVSAKKAAKKLGTITVRKTCP